MNDVSRGRWNTKIDIDSTPVAHLDYYYSVIFAIKKICHYFLFVHRATCTRNLFLSTTGYLLSELILIFIIFNNTINNTFLNTYVCIFIYIYIFIICTQGTIILSLRFRKVHSLYLHTCIRYSTYFL